MTMIRQYNSWTVAAMVAVALGVLLAVIYFVLITPVGVQPL